MPARTLSINRGLVPLLLALLLVSVVGLPARATHGGVHPTFFAERVYFQCEGDNKLQNLTLPAPWSTMAPRLTIQKGEVGCVASDPAVPSSPSDPVETDAVFEGTFTGNLRNLTVMSFISGHSGQTAQSGTVPLEVSLTIDGQQLLSHSAMSLTTDPRATAVFRLVEFTVVAVGCAREVRDANGNVVDVVTGGLATEDGFGSAQHSVHLELAYAGAVNTNRVDHLMWMWGSQEMASEIEFNDNTLASSTVQPATPATCG